MENDDENDGGYEDENIENDGVEDGRIKENDNDDSVSDETFGWLVGASEVLGVLGVAAFMIMKSRQK